MKQPKKLQLRVGGTYRNRSGEIIEIASTYHNDNYPDFTFTDGDLAYRADGTYNVTDMSSSCDLVEEVLVEVQSLSESPAPPKLLTASDARKVANEVAMEDAVKFVSDVIEPLVLEAARLGNFQITFDDVLVTTAQIRLLQELGYVAERIPCGGAQISWYN